MIFIKKNVYIICKHTYPSYPEFGASEEAGALEDLLRAYDDGDEEAGSLVLARPIFKYLDNMVGVNPHALI